MSPNLILVCVGLMCMASVHAQQRQWTNLKVHYSLNPLSKYYYQSQPRQLSSMKSNDWTNISGDDCTNGGKYNGFRYMKNGEPGMALLFDVQGTIAGIQQIVDKAEIETNNNFRFDKVPTYNPDYLNDKPVYVLTAYFVDPASICTVGRPSADLSGPAGTGTLIQVQNGTTPTDLLMMPRKRCEAIAQGWSKNKCFVGMGYHNFYKVEEIDDKDCLEAVPYFGLYDNNGDQIGFGFTSTGTSTSNFFEHPPALAVKSIVGDMAPQCLLDQANNQGLSTMHVFFTDKPSLYNCILSSAAC